MKLNVKVKVGDDVVVDREVESDDAGRVVLSKLVTPKQFRAAVDANNELDPNDEFADSAKVTIVVS